MLTKVLNSNNLQKFLKRNHRHIGLDVGSHMIKAVEFASEPENGFYPVINHGMVPLAEGALAEGIIQKPEEVVQSLKGLTEQLGFQKKTTVTLGVTGKQIIIRQMRLPKMPLEELDKALRFEAERYISVPLEETYLDYAIISETLSDGAAAYNLLVAAAPKQQINNICQVVEQAGLTPVAIDIEPIALFRFIHHCYSSKQLANQAIVNIGHTCSHFVVFKEDTVQYNRIIPLAGNQLTKAIMQMMGKDVAAAEEEKHKVIRLRTPYQEEESLMQDDNRAKEVIVETLAGLVSEIQRSIDFYQMQAKVQLDRLIVTGGTANMQGFDLYLETELRLPVLIGSYNGLDPIYSLASGLALRDFTKI
ncbi:MAG: type IV pilus assembly protein PilM [Bacillota bacterium]|nr:type IV pilus assembly protein PilM [Bacillota bacterium]